MRLRCLLQFRLATLFWLMLVVAAGIGGYRAGIEEQLSRQRQGTFYVRAYPVKDLVLSPGMTKPDFQSLIDQLVLLSPQKWSQVGGAGNIAGYDEAGVIVVYQDAPTHRQIHRKLSAFRRLSRFAWLNAAIDWIYNDEPT